MRTVWKSRSPLRLDFAGGFTDVAPFSTREGGAVLNVAITLYSSVSIRFSPDSRISILSDDYRERVVAEDLDHLRYDGRLDLVKAALKRMNPSGGLGVHIRCDAPPNAGLGASGATGVALLSCLDLWRGKRLDRRRLAERAHLLEVEELHVPGGKQDQYAAAYGGLNLLEFREKSIKVHPLKIPQKSLLDLRKHLVLCYSGIPRVSGNLIRSVMASYMASRRKTIDALFRLREIAYEMREALVRREIGRFASLLQEAWERNKSLDASINNRRLDDLFRTARRCGAIAGKAMGAGGGGCVLFFCDENRERFVKKGLRENGIRSLEFEFDFRGVRVW